MIERNVSLKDFIGIYDNYVSNQDCEQAIKFFNDKQKFNQTMNRVASENADGIVKKDAQFFAEPHNVEIWSDTLKPLIFNFDTALKHYENNTGIKNVYGNKDFSYTNFKIQKTLPSEGYHVWHIEHTTGFNNSNRILSYIIYLNDVEEGGETEFLHQSVRVKPKKNRIVIFPATFPYLHRGNPPLKGEKYIFTSWMLAPYND
tara:strand:- start:831 stop:1436 length:606 start_codon:yes stop_codon:yes gene_type:complete